MNLVIVRHGESKGNVEGVISPDEVGLTEKGREQAERTARELGSLGISKMVSSDLPRAVQTASIIKEELEVDESLSVRALRECSMGDWKNLPRKEAVGRFQSLLKRELEQGKKRKEIRPPEGENSWDHQKRVMSFLNEMLGKEEKETVLIVAHSGTNRVIIGTLMGRKPPNFYDIPQENSCINLIEVEQGRRHFKRINDCSHLE